jgi:hypothetical protein
MGDDDYSMYAASVPLLFVIIAEFPSRLLRAVVSLGMIH